MMEAKLRPSLLLFLTGVTLLLHEHCEVSAIDFMQCDRRAPAGLLPDGSGSVRDNDCSQIVWQSAERLIVDPLSIKVFPGQVFEVNISALDEYGQSISTIITGSVATGDGGCSSAVTPLFGSTDTNFAVLESGQPTTVPVRILGSENQAISLVISTSAADSAGRVQACLNISLLSCGFGFKFNPGSQACICDTRMYSIRNDVTCDLETHLIKLRDDA